MNPFDFLPHRVDILFPEIRIGSAIARKQVNVRRAIEYLQTGLYRQEFSSAGEFIGIVYSPQTAKPLRPKYIPEELGPIEILGVKFIQPPGVVPTYLRTVTESFAF
jgi:hypothetical protein